MMGSIIVFFFVVLVLAAVISWPAETELDEEQEDYDGQVKLFVLLPKSWQSRLLEAELTRDWTKTALGRRLENEKWNRKSDWVRQRVRLMRLPLSFGKPRYGWSPRGPWFQFDPQTFRVSTWPILTLEFLLKDRIWVHQCGAWELETGLSYSEVVNADDADYRGWMPPPPQKPRPPWEQVAETEAEQCESDFENDAAENLKPLPEKPED